MRIGGMQGNEIRGEAQGLNGEPVKLVAAADGNVVLTWLADAIVETYQADPIPIGEPFVVMEEELMHPGDPAGSAENVINCQCIELAVAAPKQTSE